MENWQTVDDRGTTRLEVPGGWLVKVMAQLILTQKVQTQLVGKMTEIPVIGSLTVALTFYPDPNHEWKIESVNQALKFPGDN
jgi:hypothetical protein